MAHVCPLPSLGGPEGLPSRWAARPQRGGSVWGSQEAGRGMGKLGVPEDGSQSRLRVSREKQHWASNGSLGDGLASGWGDGGMERT